MMKKKVILLCSIVMMMFLTSELCLNEVKAESVSTQAVTAGAYSISGTWIVNSSTGKWWYRHVDGTYTTDAWEYINGNWYYFDSEGWMQSGWVYINGNWYYLGSANDGAMKSDWQYINGNWYYLGNANDGAMKSGWQYINENWYYLGDVSDGSMKYGWQHIFGEDYYLGNRNDGAMKTGKTEIDGEIYYLDTDGKRLTCAWCEDGYLGEDGKLVPGYAEDNSVSYINFMYYPDVPMNTISSHITESDAISEIQGYLLNLGILEKPFTENVVGGSYYIFEVVFVDGTKRMCYVDVSHLQMFSNGRYFKVNLEDVEALWGKYGPSVEKI